MASVKPFLVPGDNNTFTTGMGYPWTAMIGDRRIKFMVQLDSSGDFSRLTHFASGMVFANIRARVLVRAVNNGDLRGAIDAPWRAARIACLEAIEEVLHAHGAEFVLKKLDKAKVINR